VPDTVQTEAVRAEAPGRLWQDPFKAVNQFLVENQTKSPPQKINDDVCQLRSDISDKSRKDKVLILAVMVSNSPYAEDGEWRLRERYAILAALNVAQYVPRNQDRIQFFRTFVDLPPPGATSQPAARASANSTPPCTRPGQKANTFLIPYEWLDRAPAANGNLAKSVVVLWLDDAMFVDHPAAYIGRLARQLWGSSTSPPGNISLKVIGPDSSNGLTQLLKDPILSTCPQTAGDDGSAFPDRDILRAQLKGVDIYSARATAANIFVDPAMSSDQLNRSFALGDSGPGLNLRRVIGADDRLALALCDELALRGVDVQNDQIVLVGEWDTVYGRALPRTFAAATRAYGGDEFQRRESMKSWLSSASNSFPPNLHRFSYLRGVDGVVPRGTNSQKKSETDSEPASPKESTLASLLDGQAQGVSSERPDGSAQLDYMRRIADEISRLDTSSTRQQFRHTGIAAIGVLGTDVYDKLLVLQALHERFPTTLFFTTDLDNRLLHPKELNWTRNLIIASNFGLQLRREINGIPLQGDIPPFRDNYQTAVFESCLLAVGWIQPDTVSSSTARLFLAARGDAVDISTKLDDPVHPPSRVRWGIPQLLVTWVLVVPAMIFFGAFLAVAMSALARDLWLELWRRPWRFPAPKLDHTTLLRRDAIATHRNQWNVIVEHWRLLNVFLVYLGVMVLLSLAIFFCYFYRSSFESFTVFGGVSVWPTVLLQCFAIFLSVFYLYRARHALHHYAVELAEQYRLKFPPPVNSAKNRIRLNECWRSAKSLHGIINWDLVPRPSGVRQLWSEFLTRSSIPNRVFRVGVLTGTYTLASALIFWRFGWPNQPHRGWFSEVVGVGSAWVSFVAMVGLTFFVVDATRLCEVFARKLSDEATPWPLRFRRRYAHKRNMNAEDVGELLDIEVLSIQTDAVGRLIFYPFTVIFILLLARMNLFDRWDWPISMLVVYGLIIIFAVLAAAMLRRSAERARGQALERLNKKLLEFRGSGGIAAARVEQILLIIETIKNNKRGAFASMAERPLIQAIMIPAGGLSAVGVLNLLLGPR